MFEVQFSSLSEFLSMGNYAFNVWSVYALFTLFFAINIVYPLMRKKQIVKELKRRVLLGGQNKVVEPAPGQAVDPE